MLRITAVAMVLLCATSANAEKPLTSEEKEIQRPCLAEFDAAADPATGRVARQVDFTKCDKWIKHLQKKYHPTDGE